MSAASAPSRGDKLTIGFGLVSIPVVILNGVDEDAAKIARNLFTPEGNRVSLAHKDAESGTQYSLAELVKRYTTTDGAVVDLSDDEIAAAMAVENGTAELVGVFPLAEFSKYRTAGPVQVRPQTTKVGSKVARPYDKAFALFFGALGDADRFALIKYVTRGKPKLLALFSDATGAQVYWANEVRAEAPLPLIEVTEGERAAAASLLDALTYDEAPLLVNEAVEAVRTYAELKAVGEAPAVAPAAAQVDPAVDLMELLSASVAASKAKKVSA